VPSRTRRLTAAAPGGTVPGMDADALRRGRIAATLTAAAFAWACFLVVRVAVSDGFVAEHGLGTLALFAIPAVLVAVGWLGLHRACSTGSHAGRRLGGTAAVVLLVFSILGGFSIGFLAWYSAYALLAAAVLTPLGGAATAGRSCSPA
jgi:drug/metabolite transporter (DMT)-like permease